MNCPDSGRHGVLRVLRARPRDVAFVCSVDDVDSALAAWRLVRDEGNGGETRLPDFLSECLRRAVRTGSATDSR